MKYKNWEEMTLKEQILQKKLQQTNSFNEDGAFFLETNDPKVMAAYLRLKYQITIPGQPKYPFKQSYTDFQKWEKITSLT